MLDEVFGELVPLRERYDRLRRNGPTPGSLAAADDKTEIGRLPLAFARMQWITRSDHLLTWALVSRGGIQPWYGHTSLIRQGLEGAVTARWLMEPTLTPDDRRQRGAAILQRDYEDRLDWEKTTDMADKPIPGREMTATERLAELATWRESEGVASTPRMPGPTRLFRDHWMNHPSYAWPWNGKALFQALSSISHNRQWSILFMQRERLGADSAGVSGSQDVVFTASGPFAVVFTACAVATLRAALEEIDAYCGVGG